MSGRQSVAEQKYSHHYGQKAEKREDIGPKVMLPVTYFL
jgi:hypothetical protein